MVEILAQETPVMLTLDVFVCKGLCNRVLPHTTNVSQLFHKTVTRSFVPLYTLCYYGLGPHIHFTNIPFIIIGEA